MAKSLLMSDNAAVIATIGELLVLQTNLNVYSVSLRQKNVGDERVGGRNVNLDP